MPARIKGTGNGLSAMRAFPVATGRVPPGALTIVAQESNSLVVGIVIENPQFRERRRKGHFAAERRDILIPDGRGDAVAVQDRFAMSHFVESRMLKYFSHTSVAGDAFCTPDQYSVNRASPRQSSLNSLDASAISR